MTKKLLVIIPDRLSVLIQKGEVVSRYYNPGNLFEEVHILMTNDDQPDLKLVQPMVGSARLFIHNHPEPKGFFKKTLGWTSVLIQYWLNQALKKIKEVSPDIIRCYGMHLNLAIGVYAKKKLNIPLLVSLHTHPVLDSHREMRSLKNKIIKSRELMLARNLKSVDLVLPVYQGIVDFIESIDVNKYQILYNAVDVNVQDTKTEFDSQDSFKMICVGQQIMNKNPENIIKAISYFNDVILDIVGMGKLNNNLRQLVNELGLNEKVKFISSIPHLELCKSLKYYDCMTTCIDCIGISKTVIEAFLVKLPVLINLNSHQQVPELKDSICLKVPNTVCGYVDGIKKLKKNKEVRIKLAEEAYTYAWEKWDPKKIEQQHIIVYKQHMQT